ncbi:fimbrillin family protein [Bacteroides heparinolyticus]|uniref:Fimbrillin family protein n=1 Tax=Prevotella heparinolytica TaxID=28113 RepID=A0A3P2A7P8_9BACE|nr:fimbrillin family protein [Bacteroides heparinolyticus]RRD91427.1 fimbrillin family protein [Bacteroides heparinolyticus]
MEKKHFMGMLAAGAAALLLSTIPAGCTDERDEGPSTGGRIGFAVDLWKEGSAAQATQTKGTGTEADGLPADTLPAVGVIALEGGASGDGKPLYLHAVTTDGIVDEATAEDGGEAVTKAAPVTTATMHEEMSVTAFVYPASGSWPSAYTGGSATSYMRTVRVKKSESWNTSYYWPGASRRISFFASAPYGSPGLTAFNDGASGNPPYLSYTVPAGVADQKDLLVAASADRPGNTNAAEALAMKHALTAVRFVTGDDMLAGTVSKITLKNVYGTGKLPLQASAAWYDLGGTTSFAQTFSPEAVAPDPQVPDTELTPEAATFMMLPQTLPAGAQIEVVYKDNLTNTTRTLTANIAGKTWPMGKTVTYRISTNSIVITPTLAVTAPANEYLYTGGTQNFTVRSYATVTGGGATGTKPIAWTAEFSEDGGGTWNPNPPAWLTAFTPSGTGSSSTLGETCTATVAPQVNSAPPNPHTVALQNAPQVTNYDLSTHDYQGNTAPMRTANCYIVNAPGSYRLPLVYGNAIKNGATNSSAYTSTASGTNVLTPFINHLGNGITNPYIYNNASCTPNSCTLLWQDEPNLVTNVALSADSHFLEFTVNQATIRQGNAVVAVKGTASGNPILWSWHIWVTDYRPGTTGTATPDKEITNHQNHKYKIMAVNLGWCDGKEEIYAERTVQVRFKQKPTAGYTSAATQTITVKQKAHTITELGNCTYFQWGRKDPFVGALEGPNGSLASINKTWYDASGTSHTNAPPATSSFSYNDCIKSGIGLPNTFCMNSYMDNKYANLWSANNTVYTNNDNPVVKTIYDPCPAGYKMPPGNAFTGFTTTGENTSTSSFNVSGAWNKGWNFYCGLNHTGSTVFFPSMGCRYYSLAGPWHVGHFAYYWTAGPYHTRNGRYLYFYSGNVYPLHNYFRTYGFGVRPCQE